MKTRLIFRYIFLAIGDRVSHEWKVSADYSYVEESLHVLQVFDYTLGWDAGEIKFSDLPNEHINSIIKTGLRAGRHEYEQRKNHSTAQGGAI